MVERLHTTDAISNFINFKTPEFVRIMFIINNKYLHN